MNDRPKCPKCRTGLWNNTIAKYGEGRRVYKIIGEELFCPNRGCDYES